MEDLLQEKRPTSQSKKLVPPRNYRRLFVLVLVIALLGQLVSFIQLQVSNYHHTLAQQFKIMLTATEPLDSPVLAEIENKLGALPQVQRVKLFSVQEGLQVLKKRNPRLVQALVALGREPMPVYFEVYVTDATLHHIRPFAQQLAVQYPELSLHYSPEQADMAFYSGLCLRSINILAALVWVLLLVFMFMVEAYALRVQLPRTGAVVTGVLASVVAFGLVVAVIYPTGLLSDALRHFTSWERQAGQLVLGGLLGWTLGKWQKF